MPTNSQVRLFLNYLCVYLVFISAVAAIHPCRAQVYQTNVPIGFSVKDASVIVVAQLVDYIKTSRSVSGSENAYLTADEDSVIAWAGKYRFRALYFIKGKAEGLLQVDFPAIQTPYYNGTKFSLAPKDTVLLFLKIGSRGQLLPASTDPSLIRLINNDATNQEPKSAKNNFRETIVSLLLASLEDDTLRPSAVYFLQDFSDSRIPGRLLFYAEDKNVLVQDAVLSCLAINQQAEVIPQILKLHDKFLAEGRGETISVLSLERLRTPRAVPALNTALFNHNTTVRMCAGWSLRAIKSKDSIPYFVLALHDSNESVASTAYMCLHEIVPNIGPHRDVLYFDAHRQVEIDKIMAWWRDELNDKHPHPERHKNLSTPSPIVPPASQTTKQP